MIVEDLVYHGKNRVTTVTAVAIILTWHGLNCDTVFAVAWLYVSYSTIHWLSFELLLLEIHQ